MVAVLKDLEHHKANAIVQDEAGVTLAPKISEDFGKVQWNKMSAEEIYCRHRAVGYKVPLFTIMDGKRVWLLELQDPAFIRPKIAPATAWSGTVFSDKKTGVLFVKCADEWIGCTVLKMEGKLKMKAKDFVNGYLPKAFDS
ncbi:hypothetical protein HK104_011258 [Borealophlyctis nickersoniae]|nr:hypothetical protein HK104_011258 [Borealophlyctis nickersoniae]